jgi:hypothetical protein
MPSYAKIDTWKTSSGVTLNNVFTVVPWTDSTERTGSMSTTPVATGMTISYTPVYSGTSVLISISICMGSNYNTNVPSRCYLYKNGSALVGPVGAITGGENAEMNGSLTHIMFRDTNVAKDVSATYQIYVDNHYSSGYTWYLNRPYGNLSGGVSSGFIMEISG